MAEHGKKSDEESNFFLNLSRSIWIDLSAFVLIARGHELFHKVASSFTKSDQDSYNFWRNLFKVTEIYYRSETPFRYWNAIRMMSSTEPVEWVFCHKAAYRAPPPIIVLLHISPISDFWLPTLTIPI